MKNRFNKADEISRRNFMGGIAAASLSLSIAPNAANAYSPDFKDVGPLDKTAGVGTASSVIYLYMSGGMSHVDTFDPKPGNEPVCGPVKAIKTSADGIQVSEYLPRLAKHMHNSVLFRSMISAQGAHQQGRYYLHTSYAKRGTLTHPDMGSWVMKMGGKLNPALPGNVRIGGGNNSGNGYFPSWTGALPLGDAKAGLQHSKRSAEVSDEQFEGRYALSRELNKAFVSRYTNKGVQTYKEMYNDAFRLMASKDLEAFDILNEDNKTLEAYGDNNFGLGCLLARRLVENNVRFVEVNLGGWDTHNDNFNRVQTRAEVLDQGVAALMTDLNRRGLLESTLIVISTEFGRTPKIVNGNGRNHYPKAFSFMMAGGGLKGGQVYGKTDKDAMNSVENTCRIPDFNATMAYALGLPVDKIVTSPAGRPFSIADKGIPVTSIF
jgi:hypothetical protein